MGKSTEIFHNVTHNKFDCGLQEKQKLNDRQKIGEMLKSIANTSILEHIAWA